MDDLTPPWGGGLPGARPQILPRSRRTPERVCERVDVLFRVPPGDDDDDTDIDTISLSLSFHHPDLSPPAGSLSTSRISKPCLGRPKKVSVKSAPGGPFVDDLIPPWGGVLPGALAQILPRSRCTRACVRAC